MTKLIDAVGILAASSDPRIAAIAAPAFNRAKVGRLQREDVQRLNALPHLPVKDDAVTALLLGHLEGRTPDAWMEPGWATTYDYLLIATGIAAGATGYELMRAEFVREAEDDVGRAILEQAEPWMVDFLIDIRTQVKQFSKIAGFAADAIAKQRRHIELVRIREASILLATEFPDSPWVAEMKASVRANR